MKEYTFEVSGVCSQEVSFALDEQNRVHNVRFLGGCPGNLLAIGKLIEGADASHVATLLKGNDCGGVEPLVRTSFLARLPKHWLTNKFKL